MPGDQGSMEFRGGHFVMHMPEEWSRSDSLTIQPISPEGLTIRVDDLPPSGASGLLGSVAIMSSPQRLGSINPYNIGVLHPHESILFSGVAYSDVLPAESLSVQRPSDYLLNELPTRSWRDLLPPSSLGISPTADPTSERLDAIEKDVQGLNTALVQVQSGISRLCSQNENILDSFRLLTSAEKQPNATHDAERERRIKQAEDTARAADMQYKNLLSEYRQMEHAKRELERKLRAIHMDKSLDVPTRPYDWEEDSLPFEDPEGPSPTDLPGEK